MLTQFLTQELLEPPFSFLKFALNAAALCFKVSKYYLKSGNSIFKLIAL